MGCCFGRSKRPPLASTSDSHRDSKATNSVNKSVNKSVQKGIEMKSVDRSDNTNDEFKDEGHENNAVIYGQKDGNSNSGISIERRLSTVSSITSNSRQTSTFTVRTGKYARKSTSDSAKHQNVPSVAAKRDSKSIPDPKRGLIRKQGGRFKTFAERFFILKKGRLTNFLSESDSTNPQVMYEREQKTLITLQGYKLHIIEDKHHIILESSEGNKIVLELKKSLHFSLWCQAFKEHVAYANGRFHLIDLPSDKDPGSPVDTIKEL